MKDWNETTRLVVEVFVEKGDTKEVIAEIVSFVADEIRKVGTYGEMRTRNGKVGANWEIVTS